MPTCDIANIPFAEPAGAEARLARLAVRLDRDTYADLLSALAQSTSPDQALAGLARLSTRAGIVESWAAGSERVRWFETLCALFGGSRYLGEMVQRDPTWANLLRDTRALAAASNAATLAASAHSEAVGTDGDAWDALRRWQQRELLRVGSADLLGLSDLQAVVRQISDIADACIQAGLELAARETGIDPSGLCILALGKLGGRELNYSSDIDLVMVAESEPSRYQRLATTLIGGLSSISSQGFLYRVDMRLRPWGSTGPLVPSRSGYQRYLEHRAGLWERQALIKARAIAGDREVAQRLVAALPALIYTRNGTAQAGHLRDDVRGMKRRIEEQLQSSGQLWGEVKRGVGSIRDIEFTTQYLQLLHGAAYPAVRGTNTLHSLDQLRTNGLLPIDDHRVLSEGYTFLRPIEHYLQLMDDRQTHHLPQDAHQLGLLARRLGFAGAKAGAQLLTRYEAHSRAIRAVYAHYMERADMDESRASNTDQPEMGVAQHIARMDASYAQTFAPDEIAFHAQLAGRLDRHNRVRVHAEPAGPDTWRLTLVAYDYPGELSFICGLLFAHGLDIREGWVYSYEPQGPHERSAGDGNKIVDVFTVAPVAGEVAPDLWDRYAADLQQLLIETADGHGKTARGRLARQVAQALRWRQGAPMQLMPPIDVEIDNVLSARYTVLRIAAPDTLGFLYELTNALALRGLNVARVTVESRRGEARDTLFLTDNRGQQDYRSPSVESTARRHGARQAFHPLAASRPRSRARPDPPLRDVGADHGA